MTWWGWVGLWIFVWGIIYGGLCFVDEKTKNPDRQVCAYFAIVIAMIISGFFHYWIK